MIPFIVVTHPSLFCCCFKFHLITNKMRRHIYKLIILGRQRIWLVDISWKFYKQLDAEGKTSLFKHSLSNVFCEIPCDRRTCDYFSLYHMQDCDSLLQQDMFYFNTNAIEQSNNQWYNLVMLYIGFRLHAWQYCLPLSIPV